MFQSHFLFGRCVSAEAAAVFAAGLDFGFLSTFDAADAAFAFPPPGLSLKPLHPVSPPLSKTAHAQSPPSTLMLIGLRMGTRR